MPVSVPRFNLKSKSITEEQKEKLRQLFPEVFTEDKIDWERLRLTLGADIDDEKKERFGLTWRGKAECFRIIQEPSIGTLKPAKEESVDWDTTENLFIEGDNLETLKLLQKAYYGKVKMIYIDPPYNTGKEFIYPDKFSESLDTYLVYTGQVDADGRKFSTNTETTGRYHSNWLDMMYPRLFLARNLLRDDGVIFISIDDHEVHNLREMMNEIFGEENFVGTIIWKGATDNNPTQIAVEHEYILCYAKDRISVNPIWKNHSDKAKQTILNEYSRLQKRYKDDVETIQTELRKYLKVNSEVLSPLTHYNRVDENGPYTGSRKVHNPKPGGYEYDVIHPVTKKPCVLPANGYRFPPETMKKLLEESRILFGDDETQIIQIKEYLVGYEGKLSSVIGLDSRSGANEIEEIFSERKLFLHPKPKMLLSEIFDFVLENDDILLDFFAGSCTSADVVNDLNLELGGKRKFIMVQLPEPTGEDSEAFKAGYKTIADIGKERIRRVISKIKQEQKDAGQQKTLSNEQKTPIDLGFRVFKLDKSNFKVWDGRVPADGKVEKQLADFIDNLHTGGTDEDILYELLLKSGFALTTPVSEKKIAGKNVFSIDNDALLICLEHNLTKDLIVKMAETKPTRAICLDAGFNGNDQLRTNALEIMKSHGVADFRTV